MFLYKIYLSGIFVTYLGQRDLDFGEMKLATDMVHSVLS